MPVSQNVQPDRLVIFSGVKHHNVDGNIIAHAGFVREVNLWAKIFREVVVAAVFSEATPQADAVPYGQPNVTFVALDTAKRTVGLAGKLQLVASIPRRLINGARLLQPNTVVMARGPDSVGFLGVLLTRINRLKRFAKYADQWSSYAGEAIGYRIQRTFYRSGWFGGPILIYGVADPSRPYLVPLNIPSSVSLEDWNKAGENAQRRSVVLPYRLLFVGRVTAYKDIRTLLKALRQLRDNGVDVVLDVVGDGDDRENLVAFADALHLDDAVVRFHGWLSRDEVMRFYSAAFCLVNCSTRQGIDKTLPEAMTHAVPVVTPNVSMSRAVVNPPECGLEYELGSVESLVDAITQLLANPDEARRKGMAGRERVQKMTLENLEASYRDFVRQHLGLQLA